MKRILQTIVFMISCAIVTIVGEFTLGCMVGVYKKATSLVTKKEDNPEEKSRRWFEKRVNGDNETVDTVVKGFTTN